MGSRRRSRIIAFQALYAWDINNNELSEFLNFDWLEREPSVEEKAFAGLLIAGTIENIGLIDDIIKDRLEHWDIKRLAKIDLAILRMSVYSLRFQTDIPPNITIDEAIDIAKQFGTDESYKFINGVLDGVRKNLKSL